MGKSEIVGLAFLGLAEFLSSSSDEESVCGDGLSSVGRPFLSFGGMRSPSPVAQRTSRSTSASVVVLRKRFDGWGSGVYFLESVGLLVHVVFCSC